MKESLMGIQANRLIPSKRSVTLQVIKMHKIVNSVPRYIPSSHQDVVLQNTKTGSLQSMSNACQRRLDRLLAGVPQ